MKRCSHLSGLLSFILRTGIKVKDTFRNVQAHLYSYQSWLWINDTLNRLNLKAWFPKFRNNFNTISRKRWKHWRHKYAQTSWNSSRRVYALILLLKNLCRWLDQSDINIFTSITTVAVCITRILKRWMWDAIIGVGQSDHPEMACMQDPLRYI